MRMFFIVLYTCTFCRYVWMVAQTLLCRLCRQYRFFWEDLHFAILIFLLPRGACRSPFAIVPCFYPFALFSSERLLISSLCTAYCISSTHTRQSVYLFIERRTRFRCCDFFYFSVFFFSSFCFFSLSLYFFVSFSFYTFFGFWCKCCVSPPVSHADDFCKYFFAHSYVHPRVFLSSPGTRIFSMQRSAIFENSGRRSLSCFFFFIFIVVESLSNHSRNVLFERESLRFV